MKKSKLITLLKKFSKEEMKEFGKFVSSPFFLKGKNLKPIYSVLKIYHPSFDSDNFTEEKVFLKLNPKKKFDRETSPGELRVRFSQLNSLAEKFMVYKSFEDGKFDYHYDTILAESFREKDINEPVIKLLQKNSELIDKNEKDYDYFFKRLETNLSLAGVYYTKNNVKESYKHSYKNLLYIYAFLFDMMNKYVNDYFVNRYTYNYEYKGFVLIEHFIYSFDPKKFDEECEDDEFETKNLVLLNYYIIKSRLGDNFNNDISNAVKIYFKIFTKLSRFAQWYNFALLFNRLFGRIRSDVIYLNKANELIDFVWQKGVFSTHRKINLHIGSYLSAFSVKTALVDSKELSHFIKKYSDKVDPESVQEIQEYSNAFLYFKECEFRKSLKILSKSDKLQMPAIKINKYKLKICCLYELSFLEEALFAIDSFEHFLRRNKNVSEIVKNENMKYLAGIKKLIKARLGEYSEPDIEYSKIIELTQNSIFGYWFRKKVLENES